MVHANHAIDNMQGSDRLRPECVNLGLRSVPEVKYESMKVIGLSSVRTSSDRLLLMTKPDNRGGSPDLPQPTSRSGAVFARSVSDDHRFPPTLKRSHAHQQLCLSLPGFKAGGQQ